ncbi:MAG TPA: LuxR C-terminal-related transcriptional regulator [Pseudonocardiaceae bacterium]|jgi:DNA-binding CsgD family transcriptional regulator
MGAEWPLTGRRGELSIIGRALGDGQLRGLLLAGAPGVGKTRLAREALSAAQARGCSTEWAVASRAAAAVPFGAMAHLVPAAGESCTHLQVLQRTGEWLASRAGGRRVVLGVDDTHLLDDASAALVHHLAVTGVAFVIATLRTGMVAPEPVTALWKDGAAERLEVHALARTEAGDLLETALGAPVDGLTRERLWQLSRGNILYLRELVRGGRQAGSLSCTEGIWRWAGPICAPPQLVELIQARIGALPAPTRVVGEMVAFGEPLEIAVLARAGVSTAEVEEAERAGLVVTEPAGPDIRVRLGHPLFGEVIRAQTPPLRSRSVHALLAEGAGPIDERRPEDVLRIAVWHLEAGTVSEPGLLMAAADRALSAHDFVLAERLCRAAGQAGAGWPVEHLLAQALVGLGEAGPAECLLGDQFARARTDTERAAVAGVRALNLYVGLDRPTAAHAVLDEAAACISSPAQRAGLMALRGRFLLHSGCCEPALDAVNAVLNDPDIPKPAVLEAIVTATTALVAAGRYHDAIASATRGLELGQQLAHGGSFLGLDELAAMRTVAHTWSGELAAAAALAERGYGRALRARSPAGVAVWALGRGRVEEARGAVTTALGWMREAVGIIGSSPQLHPYQAFTTRVGYGALARVAGLAGDLACAQTALGQADALAGPAMRLFDTWAGPIHAWVAAARGEILTAIELALDSATDARRCGQAGFELIALYDVARLGAPARVVSRLGELATSVQGDLAPLLVAHVEALLAADGTALDDVAAAFATMGANLLAAEAAVGATGVHRKAGRAASAAAAAVRATALVASCEGACTPALARLSDPAGLTPRELEIARLAAAGMSSREIAARLVVAVRTVDNALGQVYAKLGIGGRDELKPIFVVTRRKTTHLSSLPPPSLPVPSKIG